MIIRTSSSLAFLVLVTCLSYRALHISAFTLNHHIPMSFIKDRSRLIIGGVKDGRNYDDGDGDDLVNSMDIVQLERRVNNNTRERLDLQALAIIPSEDDENDMEMFEEISDPLKVAVAAGGLTFLASLYLFQNIVIAFIGFGTVAAFASWDPLEEQSTAGAFSRVLGRGVIRASKKTQPRLNAVASAVVKGDIEIKELKQRVEELEDELAAVEEENTILREALEMQYAIERALGKFSLDQLRYFAQKNGVAIGGTKSQILKRLVKNNVIDISKYN